jgi:ADP-ribose pyrophosphatase
MAGGHFVTDRSPLFPDDGVGVILTGPDGRYLLQLRDDKPGIFFPGHWGCFGGAVDPGEDADQAMVRELFEELGLAVQAADLRRFSHFTFDLGFCGVGTIYRAVYEMVLDEAHMAALRLGEGSALRLFSAEEVLRDVTLTPYDGYALWLHVSRARLFLPPHKQVR